jgi:hypothetical protein
MMLRAALTARLADTGLRCTFHSDSSACDSASSPLASVAACGRLSIRSASTMAASGQVHGSCSDSLRARAWSHTVAQGVTSLPVPAVVGMASSWRCRRGRRRGVRAFEQGQQFAETPARGA